MRRIISKEAEEKKKKRNQLIVGLILIAVMVFSVLGYSLSGFGNSNSSGRTITIITDLNSRKHQIFGM